MVKHGLYLTPEHRCWVQMRQRCMNPKFIQYHRYGGRGIKVCERWNDFLSFLEDMGKKPSPPHSLDRIDNNGNYESGNCRWAISYEQMLNSTRSRPVTINGVTKSIRGWSRESGISAGTLTFRVRAGWPEDEILSKRWGRTKQMARNPQLRRLQPTSEPKPE